MRRIARQACSYRHRGLRDIKWPMNTKSGDTDARAQAGGRISIALAALVLALVLGGCTPGNIVVVTSVELRDSYVAAVGAPTLTSRIAARATAQGGTCMPLPQPAVMRCGSFKTSASTSATFGPYDDGVYRVRFQTWITKLIPDGTDDDDSAALMSDVHRALETWLLAEGVPRAQISRAIRRVGEDDAVDLLDR